MVLQFMLLLLLDTLFYFTLIKKEVIKNRKALSVTLVLSATHSGMMVVKIIQILAYNGDIAVNEHIDNLLDLTLLFAAGSLPKLVLTIASLVVRQGAKGRSASPLMRAGWITASIIIILVLSGTYRGRYNFTVEKITLPVAGLHPDLCSLRIVLISDLHLSSFHDNPDKLSKAMEITESLDPDIIVNAGDYVTIGWKEMVPFVETLASVKGRYGSVGIPGNHDTGIYHPLWNQEEMADNRRRIKEMIIASGSRYLSNSHTYFSIGDAIVSFTGITSTGRIPDIIYGDSDLARPTADTADFAVLISHDPNYWIENQQKVKSFDLTLAGHTHGMQLGLIAGKLRISLAAIIFPVWNGLEKRDYGTLYVNRGLGTLGFPFRIGMPPEITLIILQGES
ncbi:MAG: metallophosphoesterase [Bacteroidales bacterium]|nr:metallophosphoesterase [Bacteroidales bacterium]